VFSEDAAEDAPEEPQEEENAEALAERAFANFESGETAEDESR